MKVLKVKVISLPYIFQVLYVLCFTWARYQVIVYRTIGPLFLLLNLNVRKSTRIDSIGQKTLKLSANVITVYICHKKTTNLPFLGVRGGNFPRRCGFLSRKSRRFSAGAEIDIITITRLCNILRF